MRRRDYPRRTRQLSTATANAAFRADPTESAVCGYLALIALTGLVVNEVWKVSWADPVAALALMPIIVREGWEASKGKPAAIEAPALSRSVQDFALSAS